MSLGNLKDNGNKGNNMPYQLRIAQLLAQIAQNTYLAGPDYETRTTSYEAIADGTDYLTGDIIIRYDIILVPAGTITATIWFDQTQQTAILPPIPADLIPISTSSTNVINGPGASAVNIQDGGNSISVDESELTTALVVQVGSSITNITLAAANNNRKGLTIFNDSTANLYVKFGVTADINNSYTVKIAAKGYYESPFNYSGTIDGIWDNLNGNAYVTEITL